MQEYINGKMFLGGQLVQKDFAIKDGKIYLEYENAQSTIDLTNKIISPGFVDIHVHTRTPGFEYKEDVKHVTEAALKGGFTTIVAMSNIDPMPTDINNYLNATKELEKSEIEIIQSGRVSHNDKSINLEEMRAYTNLFTDDGSPISSNELMDAALKEAKRTDSTLLLHEEDHNLKGVGYHSNMLKENILPSFGPEYEWKVVERDIKLNKDINAKIHLQHISTSKTIELLKQAKEDGMNISSEVTPHHLFFNNSEISNDGKFKMNPPIGSKEDQEALINAFIQGDVKVIATDHAPHTEEEKSGGFAKSANGIIGLETAFAACLTKVGDEHIEKVLSGLTVEPGKIIGRDVEIQDGGKANITIIDPEVTWTVSKGDIKSKSNNSPFIGLELKGKIEKVIYGKLEREY